jgi:3-deoxy-D-manno-octulosonic-acid transferase
VLEGLKRLVDSGRPRDVIWVPHELDESEAKRARLAFASLGYEVRDLDQRGGLSEKPLAIIVMKKGILAELYRLGGAAFVGGGFGSGVHSVWEPAIAGARVACGPKTDRSPEARELQARGLLSEVDRGEAFASWLDSARSSETGIEDLLAVHRGAAKRIVEICERT